MPQYRALSCCPSQLPWLVLFVILSFAPLNVTVFYLMLGSTVRLHPHNNKQQQMLDTFHDSTS